VINHKKLFWLYREEKLAVRRRGGRKRAIGTRAPMTVPMAPNDRWSLDFVSDQLADGRRFRILTVVDDCTRECLALVADTSLSDTRVARELDRLMIERGKPCRRFFPRLVASLELPSSKSFWRFCLGRHDIKATLRCRGNRPASGPAIVLGPPFRGTICRTYLFSKLTRLEEHYEDVCICCRSCYGCCRAGVCR
jgi:hypothetical protein